MSNLMLTDGEVVDPVISTYERELERIKGISDRISNELATCRAEFAKLKLERDQMIRATEGLRRLLGPLWGELQDIPVDVTVIGVPAGGATYSRLDSVKKRMPGKPSELIDCLLENGPLSVTNIITLLHWGKNSVYQTVSKLMQAGIVVNNSGKYTLKEQ